jgi:hypothetical protein
MFVINFSGTIAQQYDSSYDDCSEPQSDNEDPDYYAPSTNSWWGGLKGW